MRLFRFGLAWWTHAGESAGGDAAGDASEPENIERMMLSLLANEKGKTGCGGYMR